MKHIVFSAFTLSGLMLASAAYGQLTLVINTVTEEMALLGSSSGQPRESGGFGSVNFGIDGLGVSSNGQFTFSSLSTLSRADTRPNPTLSTLFDGFRFTYLFGSDDSLTINGTGDFIDYRSLFGTPGPPGDPTPSDVINSIPDGAMLSTLDGTGFDGGILVSVIPEPSSFALVMGCAGALLLFSRRRGE